MKGKRVEYQKFLRNKLEDERYRRLFGFSENIELAGEEDFVLQREFRIDFVLQKIHPDLPLAGIFSHFRTHNLFEFKSVNDSFDLVTLRKYLGELFWWLYRKNDGQVQEEEVTLTMMTVRKPIKVLRRLRQPHLQIGLMNESPGHYRWSVMGIEVHLLVINELEILPKHYAWLSFAEGRKHEAYREQLSENIFEDETYQVYLDIMGELQEEGKERMADEVIRKLISRMSPERAEKLLLVMPEGLRRKWQVEGMQKMLSQLLHAKFGQLSQEAIDRLQEIESEDELSDLAQRLITASSLAQLGLST
ncbi:hypothetical protein IH992_06275 [Candidatus Poribacteria bacterium]|nr:hypothetical protein [Candidatus Poribacteria bacterium]